MPGYNLHVLGLDLSFSTEAPPERLNTAVDFLQSRYKDLESRARHLSKERLLTYLALSLADDYLHDKDKLTQLEIKLEQLVAKIDIPEKE
jgi:cell division protein ZapA